jgi:HEAT repeat protein
MPVAEWVLGKIADEVFSYILEQANVKGRVTQILGLDSERNAFKRALAQAITHLEQQHPKATGYLFDANFLEHEGTPILAQFLLRDGYPDPYLLAARCADSINFHRSEHRTTFTRDIEPVAIDFLDLLATALKAEPDLAKIHDHRALEQIAANLRAIRQSYGAEKATPGTQRDYLHWIIERNYYLDPRGTFQIQRQVQVKLDEIYVSLRAQREDEPGGVDRRLLSQDLAELEQTLEYASLSAEELEDQQEHRIALLESNASSDDLGMVVGEALELADAVKHHNRIVILGDPGSGKTTLVRYLALKHAQALSANEAQAGGDLGPTRFPILIRIADYAEHGVWRQKALSDFLIDYSVMQECPKAGLSDLLTTRLSEGNCLILLDGLDEIVNPDDRRSIVQRIENFVRRYDHPSNSFVVTSRTAGYRSAPLAEGFTHYTVQEMDDRQIRRFLEQWCLAVETAQTPELSLDARRAAAQHQMSGILQAIQTPGVRRMAANPLLLRVLALIHHTGARLPQKRIELYKLAADTLARTWRPAQGVPELALVQERYLTGLLSKLAYWLHLNKPTGLGTEREVKTILGEEWVRIKQYDREADDPEIVTEIDTFLLAVRVHTGLFVERAPRRYGFMHLTFEEYYAARYLEIRAKSRAQMIRKHLHDPRWDEPILLALGFVSLESPEDAAELIETAVLAQGEEAAALGFTASPYEALLGRDFLFALRCLADDIPIGRKVVRQLIRRLVDELLNETGSAGFQRYRQMLRASVEGLCHSQIAPAMVRVLHEHLDNEESKVRLRAVDLLLSLEQSSPEMVAVLNETLRSTHPTIRRTTVQSLNRLGKMAPRLVVEMLALALHDPILAVRRAAAQSLIGIGEADPELSLPLVTTAFNDADPSVRRVAALSLSGMGQTDLARAMPLLKAAITDPDPSVRRGAIQTLTSLSELAYEQVIPQLSATLNDLDAAVRIAAARSLIKLWETSPEIAQSVITSALKDKDATIRLSTVQTLAEISASAPELVMPAFKTASSDADPSVRRTAIQNLMWIHQSTSELASSDVIDKFAHALTNPDAAIRQGAALSLRGMGKSVSRLTLPKLNDALSDRDPYVRFVVALLLADLGQATPEVLATLIEALKHGDDWFWGVRQDAARFLGQIGQPYDSVLESLLQGLLDPDNHVRTACARALAQLGRSDQGTMQAIAQRLVQVIDDPSFAQPDVHVGRTGHDYAFDSLWMLMTGRA